MAEDPILAKRLIEVLEKIDKTLQDGQDTMREVQRLLREHVETQEDLSGDIGLWTRAFEILSANRRNGKVTLTDLTKAFEMASEEDEGGPGGDGDGAVPVPDDGPVLPLRG